MQVPGNQVKNSDEKMTKLALSWWRWGAPPPRGVHKEGLLLSGALCPFRGLSWAGASDTPGVHWTVQL